jgi:hypothetical protein
MEVKDAVTLASIGFAPDRSRRIFPVGKIHSMPSFGRGSKIICPMLVTRTTKVQKGKKRSTMAHKKKYDHSYILNVFINHIFVI